MMTAGWLVGLAAAGFVGFISCFWFVRTIYGSIKGAGARMREECMRALLECDEGR